MAGCAAAKLKEADSNAHPGQHSSRIDWKAVPKAEHANTEDGSLKHGIPCA